MDDLETYRIAQLEAKVTHLEAEISKIEEREVKRLRWGVGVLGAIVLAFLGWAWSQVEHLVQLNVGK